jgi:hypothetical protein
MTHRRIQDSEGRKWDIWEVYPSAVERRMSGEHGAIPPKGDVERRSRREYRVVVPQQLQNGWLAFQTGEERRRLAPIPERWATLADAELRELLARAERIEGSTGAR